MFCQRTPGLSSGVPLSFSLNAGLRPAWWLLVHLYHRWVKRVSVCTATRQHKFEFNAALRPQKPYGILGTGSPGRPPRLSHSSAEDSWVQCCITSTETLRTIGDGERTSIFTQFMNSDRMDDDDDVGLNVLRCWADILGKNWQHKPGSEYYAVLGACNCPELRSCVKVEVAVLGFPSLISLMVSVDVKRHWNSCTCPIVNTIYLNLSFDCAYWGVRRSIGLDSHSCDRNISWFKQFY